MKRMLGFLGVVVSAAGCGSPAAPPAYPSASHGVYAVHPPAYGSPGAMAQTPCAPGAAMPCSSAGSAALDARPNRADAAHLAMPAEPPNGAEASLDAADAGLAGADDEEHGDDTEEIDDGQEETGHDHPTDTAKPTAPSPLAGLRDEDITEKLRSNPNAFGPISVGYTNAGALVSGVQMPAGDQWVLVDPARAWGTQETVDFLKRSIQKVHAQFPGAPKLYIGHISAQKGGYLSPHVSHQSGRDVDISYYLSNGKKGFVKANSSNLDEEKTWAFVKALITDTDVEMILIDTSIQKLLNSHASRIGEDPAWLDSVFQVRRKHQRPMVRHAKGHVNHIHIRFWSPLAQELGRRSHGLFAHLLNAPKPEKKASAPPQDGYFLHRARSGDTLGILAKRYGTSVEAIREANGLKSDAIKNKQVLRIPKPKQSSPPAVSRPSRPSRPSRSTRSGPPPVPGPLNVPPRRLPPAKTVEASKTASSATL